MSEWDDECGCPRCEDAGCDECREDYESQEARDDRLGICRECETWGEFQCSVHADAYIEGQRAEGEFWDLVAAAHRGTRTKRGRKSRFRLHCIEAPRVRSRAKGLR